MNHYNELLMASDIDVRRVLKDLKELIELTSSMAFSASGFVSTDGDGDAFIYEFKDNYKELLKLSKHIYSGRADDMWYKITDIIDFQDEIYFHIINIEYSFRNVTDGRKDAADLQDEMLELEHRFKTAYDEVKDIKRLKEPELIRFGYVPHRR